MHSKEIFETHTALLETMSQANEPTSAPVGTRLDKRTAESTLKNLENRGRIRMLKTSLVAPSGVSRPACLVYLPDTPQEKVNAFLRQLTQSVPSATTGPVKVLEQPIEHGPSVSSSRHVSPPPNLLQIIDRGKKENKRLKQPSSHNSKTIRDVPSTERTTVAQPHVHSPVTGPPPVVPNPPEKSIELLITQHAGPPILPTASAKKRGKAKEESEGT